MEFLYGTQESYSRLGHFTSDLTVATLLSPQLLYSRLEGGGGYSFHLFFESTCCEHIGVLNIGVVVPGMEGLPSKEGIPSLASHTKYVCSSKIDSINQVFHL